MLALGERVAVRSAWYSAATFDVESGGCVFNGISIFFEPGG